VTTKFVSVQVGRFVPVTTLPSTEHEPEA
jgi:hypothetical protein